MTEHVDNKGTLLLRDLIMDRMPELTASERKLCATLLDSSLVVGLQSITKVADEAEVSSPTVIRLARKLGFDGFPDLQDHIRAEFAARVQQPLAKLESWQVNSNSDHIVNRFSAAISDNINGTLERLDLSQFDRVSELLSDSNRDIALIGGRITGSIADLFFTHLQIIRPRVTLLTRLANVWPHYVLDMNEETVLVMFDIRRYEKELEQLAKLAYERNVDVVLFTDQWGSPIEKYATVCFRTMVQAPSSWDSTMGISFIVEALVADVQSRRSEDSIERIGELEKMLGQTHLFGD